MEWKYYKNSLPLMDGEYVVYVQGVVIAHYNADGKIWELPSGLCVRAESGIVSHWFKPTVPGGVR